MVIVDTSLLGVVPIPPTMALGVTSFIGDTNRPSLDAFDFDLNRGTMLLQFNETVDVSTINLEQFTFRSIQFMGDIAVNLETTPLPVSDSATLILQVSRGDLNRIKSLPVCTMENDCYISFPETVLNDTSSNMVIPVVANQAIRVGNFTPDTSPPVLEQFAVFDRNEGFIVLSFSETINIDSLQPDQITLQSRSVAATEAYSLTGAVYARENTDVLTVNFTSSDLNALKSSLTLCSFREVCVIRFSQLLLQDTAGNNITAVSDAVGFNISYTPPMFIDDTTTPRLMAFHLDMTLGRVTLQFDETVNGGGLNTDEIVFTDALNSTESVRLQRTSALTSIDPPLIVGGEILRSPTLYFDLIVSDLQVIQANIDLATSQDNTFITFSSNMITDTASIPNSVIPALDSVSSIQVQNYTRDLIRPRLAVFTQLDMNTENIRLEFSEPMNLTNIDFSGITIRAGMNSSVFYQLTGGGNPRFIDMLRQVIHFDLTAEDVRGIKLLSPTLATGIHDSYIAIASNSFIDTAGNPNEELAITMAIQVDQNNYRSDSTPPSLLSFQLDVNFGIFNLTFNDVIDVMSVIPTSISLQSEQVRGRDTDVVTFTNANPVSNNDYTVMIQLVASELNSIKAIPTLATDTSNTYIVLGSNAFTDVAGTFLFPVIESNALRASFVRTDTGLPILMSFTFNASTGVLVFMFDEVVNISSINPPAFVLQNVMTLSAPQGATVRFRRLTGGSPTTYEPSRIFSFMLNREDINYIKEFTDFGTSENNTFIAVDSTAVSDMAGNRLVTIPDFFCKTSSRSLSRYSSSYTGVFLLGT